MPNTQILKVRTFHLPTANRFDAALEKPIGAIMPPPILNRVKFLIVVIRFINYYSEAFKTLFYSCQYLTNPIKKHWVYDKNFHWGVGVVEGEGVTVKNALSGVVGVGGHQGIFPKTS